MLTTNYIKSFFHTKETRITGCYQTDEGLVYEVQLPVTTRACPYCGQDTTRIKDYRVRAVTLGTIHGRPGNAKYNQRPCCRRSIPYCRLMDRAVERVRKRERKKLVTHSAMVKSNKRVLMKQPSRLTAQELIKLEEILRVSDDLRNAYRLKLAFRKAFRAWGKERILACIDRWPVLVKEADLPEFKNFFISFVSWKEEIINAFLLLYSNGYTERCNNAIKVLKRLSYGLRHFERFRIHILLISKKNGTDCYRDQCRERLVGYHTRHL